MLALTVQLAQVPQPVWKVSVVVVDAVPVAMIPPLSVPFVSDADPAFDATVGAVPSTEIVPNGITLVTLEFPRVVVLLP